jgi:hypothetical protein
MKEKYNYNFVKDEGQYFVNVCAHPLTVRKTNGEEFTIPPCGVILSATVEETVAKEKNGVTYVTPTFKPSEEGLKELKSIRDLFPDAIILGSVIAAQAYPGQVCAGIAVPGYERVPADQKRIRRDRFTVYGQ